MKKYKNVYSIVGSIVVALGLVAFSLYTTKCHGDECNALQASVIITNKEKEQIFSKMIPAIINEQVKNKEIVLLDVREDSEWKEGHIKGALHIALGNLSIETVKDLPNDIPIYIYCRSGRRAGEAEIKLKDLGFNNTEKLGGIIEWQEKGGILFIE
jgi:phage shock protein E